MLCRIGLAFILSSLAFAQAPQLTIEDIAKGTLAGRAPESIEWSPDGTKVSFIQRNDTGDHGELWYVDVTTGKKAVLVSESKLNSLAPPTSKIADERQREWRSRYGVASYHWAPDSKVLLFDSNGQFWYFRLESGVGVQITSSPDPASDPKFSHDGKRLAYIRKHDLWVRKIPDGDERQITKIVENEEVLNGEVSWVYAEELKVRSNYFWSPDDRQIAYLQMNEHAVPTYPIVDYSQQHAKADLQKYPNPGDPNSEVRVGVVDAGGGKTKWITLPVENDKDIYIPRFGWVRPGLLWIQVMNRAQNQLALYFADTNNGNAHLVLSEKSDVWVNVNDNFRLFKNGDRFLWTSWRDGHTHLYLYSVDPASEAKLVNQVTKGDFEVFTLDSVDETAGLAYFTADPNDPRQRQLFSIKLDGTDMKQISKQAGTHTASFGVNSNWYVDRFSSLYTPPALSLCKTDGGCEPISEPKDLSAYNLDPPQWLDLTAADGKTKLYGMLFLPPKETAGKKIPVILHPYGGPSGQSVRDDWGREGGLLHAYLARKGFAVLVVDNRGMANRGREFNAFLKGKFGGIELADQLAALLEVVKQYPQLDAGRVGIYGGSYGGFMVLYGMTHSDLFKAGVSISPVSSWRLYDSIYTERYLGLPTNNETGYISGSPVNDAAKLSGALRIAHGTSDDNVHAQNTIQMTQALIKAAKPFGLMLYPNKTHGINGYDAINHLYHSIEDHFAKYLKATGDTAQ
jgi:dipeptidyl-peptidase-4